MKSNEMKLEEMEAVSGGDFLGIGDTLSWTYNKMVKPVGTFVFNVVKYPFKPLIKEMEEMEKLKKHPRPLQDVKSPHCIDG